ncbi:hypothetical protein ACJX0J_039298, partial [Zea mays]
LLLANWSKIMISIKARPFLSHFILDIVHIVVTNLTTGDNWKVKKNRATPLLSVFALPDMWGKRLALRLLFWLMARTAFSCTHLIHF